MGTRQEKLAEASADGGETADSRPEDEALVKIAGVVKWFDATRGFGFIVSEQATGDIPGSFQRASGA
jgi:CspA family cold shock protein